MPTYSDYQDEALQRQLAYSDALRKQSLGTGGQMVSGIYVPKSPWANVAEGFASGYMGGNATQGQKDLQTQRDEAYRAALGKMPSPMNPAVPGVPGTPETPWWSEEQQTAEPMGIAPATPGSAAIPATMKSPQQQATELGQWGGDLSTVHDARAQALGQSVLGKAVEQPFKNLEAQREQEQMVNALRTAFPSMGAPAQPVEAPAAAITAPGVAPPIVQSPAWNPAVAAQNPASPRHGVGTVTPMDAERKAIIQRELNKPGAKESMPADSWDALVKEGASIGVSPPAAGGQVLTKSVTGPQPTVAGPPASVLVGALGGKAGAKLVPALAAAERQKEAQAFTEGVTQKFKTNERIAREEFTAGENAKKADALKLAQKERLAMTSQPLGSESIISAGAQVAAGQPVNQVVPGYGAMAAVNRGKVRDEAISQIIAKNPGMSFADAGAELAARSIGFNADKQTATQLAKLEGGAIPIVQQLNYNIDQTSKIMQQIGGRDISPVINAVIDRVSVWTGDPNLQPLWFHMNGAALEAAKLRSGSQASVAQLNVAAMKEAQSWADSHMTPETWGKISEAMRQEGAAKLQMFKQAEDYVKRRGGGSTGAPALPASTAAAGASKYSETKSYQGKTYGLKPGADRKQQSSWEVVP